MKKIVFCGIVFFSFLPLGWGYVFVVYKDTPSIMTGEYWIGTGTEEGVLIRAKEAFSTRPPYYIGSLNGTLWEGSLSRLDNELDLALLKWEKGVTDVDLISAHRSKVQRINGFVKTTTSTIASIMPPAKLEKHPMPPSNDPFLIKINGVLLSDQAIELLVKRKESAMELEIVNNMKKGIWRADVKLESDPHLSFWKKGRRKGLNDVPRHVLRYGYQTMFRKLMHNRSFIIPIEIYHIKDEAYEFSISVEAKKIAIKKKVPIRFVEKK